MKGKPRNKSKYEVDGVWSVEAYSYSGWEYVSTAFFDNGVYRSGSADHYSIGSYSQDGRALLFKFEGHQWGRVRVLHGNKNVHSKVVGTGKLKRDGQVIEATFKEKNTTRFRLHLRYTRLGDL